MANQSPTDCKNADDARWMFNDRAQTPCQVLNASLHELNSTFTLSWLELSFRCGQSSSSTSPDTLPFLSSGNLATNSANSSSNPVTTIGNEDLVHDFCCSNVAYALYASCWSCQWDQSVRGYVRTTWADFWSNGNCSSSSSTSPPSSTPSAPSVITSSSVSLGPVTSIASSGHRWRRAPDNATTIDGPNASTVPRSAPLSRAVQRALDNANIHVHGWACLKPLGTGVWDESVARANVTALMITQSKPNKPGSGAANF